MARQPIQDRSKKTLDRILDAAELILNEKKWPDLTIQEIVKRAKSSIGSFYARFDGKHDLLSALSSRLSEQVEEEFLRFQMQSVDLPPRIYVERTIAELIRFHHERRGVIRALTLVPRLDDTTSLRADGLRNAEIFSALSHRLAEISTDLEKTTLALFVVSMAIREAVVFPEVAGPLISINHERLAKELADILFSYLE